MEQTIPKANAPVLLFASFHFVTMHMYCNIAMNYSVKGAQIPHYFLWVGNVLVSQMCRSFIIFWPVEYSCGRLGAITCAVIVTAD